MFTETEIPKNFSDSDLAEFAGALAKLLAAGWDRGDAKRALRKAWNEGYHTADGLYGRVERLRLHAQKAKGGSRDE
jgi:hypothetical protein